MKTLVFTLGLGAAAGCGAVPASADVSWNPVQSPGHRTELALGLQEGWPVYRVSRGNAPVLEPSRLMLDVSEPFAGGFAVAAVQTWSGDDTWKPLYGERTVYPGRYAAVKLHLVELGPLARRLAIEARAYDQGVAFRYLFPGGRWKIRKETSEFRFVAGSQAFPIYSTEQTFSPSPVPLAEVKPGAKTPLTIQLPTGFAAVLEADCANYARLNIGKTADGTLVTSLAGAVESGEPFTSPWRVILLGSHEGELIEHETLIPTLNPPCTLADTDWIAPGKTISNEGSAPLVGSDLEKILHFAGPNGYRYLQLDWGWYGTEWKWNDADRDLFRRTMPGYAGRTDWIANTSADPFQVARGPVPYRPDWKSVTQVDLDMPRLIRHARELGMGICLYVEAAHTLRAVDMDKLFATYEAWGVAGLKPGFVRAGSQENTRWIREMIATAAKHHLWLCIHDGHLPDGAERTYPNLFICEAGGGQEGKHPAVHDVILPFTRCLAGPFDYTPLLYTQGKTHAHMLAFLVTYYGPAQTIRGGYHPWNQGGDKRQGTGGAELEFVKRVPTVWDDTRVLDAKIAQRLVVARRSGETWYLGGMTGSEAQQVEVKLDFLTPGRAYTATLFSDDAAHASAGWCPVKRETKPVTSTGQITLSMEKAGGAVVIFDPAG